jgi:hypothetical protein
VHIAHFAAHLRVEIDPDDVLPLRHPNGWAHLTPSVPLPNSTPCGASGITSPPCI